MANIFFIKSHQSRTESTVFLVIVTKIIISATAKSDQEIKKHQFTTQCHAEKVLFAKLEKFQSIAIRKF
jgi:hypothetical protein